MSQASSAPKAEPEASAATTTPATQTPTTSYTPTAWTSSQIPIDPVLQQQSAHATTQYYTQFQHSHYPQASYGHYQPYIPPAQSAQAQTPGPVTAAAQRPSAQVTGQVDTTDVATLNDAIGSAGVDLRAEEETLQRGSDQHQAYRPFEDRSRKQPATPNFDTRFLGSTMRAIGTKHKVPKVPEDSVNYVALALRARLHDLLVAMAAASAHRTESQFDRTPSTYVDGTPMWRVSVRRDVAKQLAALERVEREEEMRVRHERKELAAAQAAALATHAPGASTGEAEDGEGGPKKKKKKADGPGVTAKNMSEDVRKKMSNAVASHAAGLSTGKYAWMNASNATPAPPTRPKPAASPAPATTTAPVTTPATTMTGSSWARPYVSTSGKTTNAAKGEEDTRRVVTLRDALFVVEKERGHGAGRGAAHGWVR
ncbi:transcription initiation factor TFIID component TAF4 family-domain-containing protein [Russula earlei]|uniref:Transcription initiation factor TFIID component TAF4 family-domain-containing protein n=1 Tax=Russula earlei TaxID=71964 RepID=A0ACC0U8J7_9AGAM|nr:transcription initiation factor TFIID component TAF4 family-domain-containing protein [Russula earlei]